MSKLNVEEVVIDGATYVKKDSIKQIVEPIDGMTYVMVRTYSAGVFCGWMKKREAKEVTLVEAIRIWRWEGAASLSQLSQEGTNKPGGCKFGMAIKEVILTEAIEVITMTESAKRSIQNVESWKN